MLKAKEMTDRGTQVLVDREGLRTTAYQDSVGVWTIGVGHTSSAGPPEVYAGLTITEVEAMEIFDRDNNYFEDIVTELVTVPLQPHEYDALVSFVFNIGETAFRDSTLLEKLNAGDKEGALEQFKQWKKPPEIIPRRRGEYACFGFGIYIARIEDDSPLLQMA
jgi:lysozyme